MFDPKEKTYKGKIINAFIMRDMVWGNVYGNCRFTDGTFIHSSRIVNWEGNRVETLNSFYDVEWDNENEQ